MGFIGVQQSTFYLYVSNISFATYEINCIRVYFLGMLERKEIDIGLADLSLTFPRIKVRYHLQLALNPIYFN